MLMYFTFRIIGATTAFLYPGYASYKALSQRPASEEELERWLMYWSVLGCIVAVEYVAEWLVSWLPLYYPAKTLFLLYLALPQTSGSAYLYTTHLRPFFAAHEEQIDSALAQFKARLYTSAQRGLRKAWEHVSATLRQMPMAAAEQAPRTEAPLEEEASVNRGAPPTLADPLSGPTQLAQGLWRNYGPSLLAGGAALLRNAQASAARGAASASESTSVEERKRQLRAELASLSEEPAPYDLSPLSDPAPSVAIPPTAGSTSRNSSSSSLRQRSESNNGRSAFEEVEVPSDMEVEGDAPGQPAPPPLQTRRTSWFGWGGSPTTSNTKGYERVKTD